ncbi:MAG: endo alpha-1,4 polygalactosaminidase [Planctomycetota bacterium]
MRSAILGLGLALVGCAVAPPKTPRLNAVRAWAALLQNVEGAAQADELAAAQVDLLVLEPTRSVRGRDAAAMLPIVGRVRRSAGVTVSRKICLAYFNVGQAEDYRSYWSAEWRAPQASQPGAPSFLLSVDPDGWEGNYAVAFWDPRWRATLWGHPDAPLDQLLADGFDGVYLDWVLAYAEPSVVAAARRDGVDPAAAMVELLADLRHYAHEQRPDFLMIQQNAIDLIEREPGVLDVIDGLAHEDLSFSGRAGAAWGQPGAGDVAAPDEGPWSTASLGERLAALAHRGVPVFTMDYAADPQNAVVAERASRALGLVPFVSRAPARPLAACVVAAARVSCR